MKEWRLLIVGGLLLSPALFFILSTEIGRDVALGFALCASAFTGVWCIGTAFDRIQNGQRR